jgi:hypothetical protein
MQDDAKAMSAASLVRCIEPQMTSRPERHTACESARYATNLVGRPWRRTERLLDWRGQMTRGQGSTKTTTNRAEIRRWVESKGGWPARVKGTERGTDPGVLRIDFPGYSGVETLAKMSWDDWFKWFDKKGLAFLHQPSTRFSKLIARDAMSTTSSTRATPRRAAGAKRATAKRGTAKRTGAPKKATTTRTTRTTAKRRSTTATGGRNVKRTTAPKRGMAKRPAKRTTAKRTGVKRTAAKRSSAKRPSR